MRDHAAFVAVFPSDHFIVEEDVFMEHVEAGYIFPKNIQITLLSWVFLPSILI